MMSKTKLATFGGQRLPLLLAVRYEYLRVV